MPKFLQCHYQSGALQKRSVSPVNDHPAIVDVFQRFCENGQCIQTIPFRVTMIILIGESHLKSLNINTFSDSFEHFKRYNKSVSDTRATDMYH